MPGTATWSALFFSYFPSFLSLSAHVSSSLHRVWSLIMFTPDEKPQHCGNHIEKECQRLPRQGHAGVSGLSSLCGHCWPRLKGIRQPQTHPHPWGPTPLILCRPLSITTSRLLQAVNCHVCPLWKPMVFCASLSSFSQWKVICMLTQTPGLFSLRTSAWPALSPALDPY